MSLPRPQVDQPSLLPENRQLLSTSETLPVPFSHPGMECLSSSFLFSTVLGSQIALKKYLFIELLKWDDDKLGLRPCWGPEISLGK